MYYNMAYHSLKKSHARHYIKYVYKITGMKSGFCNYIRGIYACP